MVPSDLRLDTNRQAGACLRRMKNDFFLILIRACDALMCPDLSATKADKKSPRPPPSIHAFLSERVMKTIFCTSGTSIAGPSTETIPFARDPDPDRYRREVGNRVKRIRNEAPVGEFLPRISAETNSVYQFLGNNGDAVVVLLHTDTKDGQICAEWLAEIMKNELGLDTRLQSVAGLQVNDEKVFRHQGIQNLFQHLDRLLDGLSPADTVLNVTGGFKSVVPYMTLFGLIRRVDVIYIHESARTLLHLPPLPLSFDFEMLGEIRDAMLKLRTEGLMLQTDFIKLIRNRNVQHEAWLRSLVDEEGEMVAPSALAALFFREQDAHVCRVLISDKAREALDQSSGGVRRQYLGMLERVSDPLWRDSKHHPLAGTDLIGIKPGNTSERMLVFLREQTVYVCELAVHDRYEEIARSRRIKDYATRSFEQWVMPSGETVEVSEEAEMDRLRNENEHAEKLIEEADGEQNALQARLSAALEEAGHRKTENNALAARILKLEAKIAEQEGLLESERSRSIWSILFKRLRCTGRTCQDSK